LRKYLIISFSAFLLELGSTFYISFVSDQNLFGMMFFAFIGPFLSLPFVGFMIDAKNWKQRILLSFSSACGYLIGSFTSYLFIKIF